ncbi:MULTISPECIES: hypothetical protein [Pseudomonas]|uniref:Uncharacterized protein n=1 Tax=Pseudomonas fluorescens TaxID=294 RepID=A0A161XFG3_PSEFL|nr:MULTISPECIES: hypothetical protein [Pseudomonas]KZN20528.1 hypothetical protein A1D17_03020 [Pseudomonas fluorescens]
MTEITQLPPQEPPKQITARFVINTLGEHWVAFLAANNMSGWTAEEEYVLRDDRFADVLLMIASSTGMYLGQLKRSGKQLRNLAAATENHVGLSKIYDMISKALGYSGYAIAYKCRTVDDFIENVWPLGAAMSLVTLDSEVRTGMSDSQVIKMLRDRHTFNQQRDGQASAMLADAKTKAQRREPANLNELKQEKKRKLRRNMFGPISSRE